VRRSRSMARKESASRIVKLTKPKTLKQKVRRFLRWRRKWGKP